MNTDNPFFDKQTATQVTVTHGNGPYQNTLEALKSIAIQNIRGKRLLLKPNAGRVAHCGEGITAVSGNA